MVMRPILPHACPVPSGMDENRKEESMSRHITDRHAAPEGGRLKNYIAVERASGEKRHPAIRELHERAATRDDAVRMREYLRIERGIRA